MFAKLKKKIADEAGVAPRSGVRIPRTVSKESIASVGADSGDDFASDGSSSRDDLPAQILRRNDQIRKLEAKLSDYAEQLRIMQKTKEKLEIALEKHQDSSIKKLQEQSEAHQASRTKMAEGMAFALEKKDEEWTEKMDAVEKEKAALSGRLEETMEQSLVLFQKRDDLDELEGFQQQELAKVKHMLLKKEELLSQRGRELRQKEAEVQSARRGLSETRGKLAALEELHEESCRINSELEIEREELLLLREEADKKVAELEGRCREMHSVIQQVSEDFQKSQSTVSSLEGIIQLSQTEQAAMKVQQQKSAVTLEDKERLITDLQKKVSSLERRLDGNLSQDEHLQELLQEKSSLEQSLEESRAELLTVRTNQADTVCSLEAQVFRMSCRISELQTLLRHKDESSRAYRERTDVQISNLEQQLLDDGERLKSAAQQITDKQQNLVKLQGEWSAEKVVLEQQVCLLEQQVCLLEQQRQEEAQRLQENISSLQTDRRSLQDRLADVDQQRNQTASVLRERTDELERCREELSHQQTENNEVSKVQEEIRQQKDKLQTQVRTLTASLHTSQQEVTSVTEKLTLREENTAALQNELHCVQVSLLHLQEEVEQQRAERVQLEQLERDKDSELMIMREELLAQTQQLDGCQARISYLEVEVETLTEQLQSPPVCEEDQNGSVTVDDVDDVQKVNRELEQQLSDKNMTIRQLQQRLAELKRTLQKELKLKPEPDPEGKEGSPESRADKQDKVSPDPQPASSPSPRPSRTTVTNTSDLNDSREINFEYLKHVVLKFMSSREAEAYQLIRAVSVLLNFSREEEELLKQTLDYKMSWFGSKPSPKGTIRPSVSGSSSNWS